MTIPRSDLRLGPPVGVGLLPGPRAREAGRRPKCGNNLKQIGLAMANYCNAYGRFPPAVIADASGRPMHSWRLLLLPFLLSEEKALYSSYNFDQPWDGPDNIRLADRMPAVYRCPSDKGRLPGL